MIPNNNNNDDGTNYISRKGENVMIDNQYKRYINICFPHLGIDVVVNYSIAARLELSK